MTFQLRIGLALVLALGLAAVVYFAHAAEPLALLGSAAAVNLLVAASGARERRTLRAANASRSLIEGATARTMGVIWLWGAAALVLIYTTVMSWREWTHFSAAFAGAGLLCLGFAALLKKDADKGREDATLLRLGRYLAIGQLLGMLATLAGLVIDPDKEILYATDNDWAGNGIFLFGAVALAIVSAYALIDGRKDSP